MNDLLLHEETVQRKSAITLVYEKLLYILFLTLMLAATYFSYPTYLYFILRIETWKLSSFLSVFRHE